MNLSPNQKIVLLLFIIAIVSVIFMEYTREYLDFSITDLTARVNAAVQAAANPPPATS
jgi:hypothetical protein